MNCVTKVGKLQPISSNNMPSTYRVNAIRREDARMPRFERETFEDEIERKKNFAQAYYVAVQNANLKDRQLLDIAKHEAHRDDKYKFNTYAAAMVGVPVLDTFVRGTLTGAPKLSGKLGSMGRIAAGWGGAFALAGLYNGVVEKITAVSPVVRSFEERHPVIKSLLSLAGFAALFVGAQKGVHKIAETLPKKLPGVMADFGKIKARLAENINASKFNKHIVQPVKAEAIEFIKDHPKLATTGIAALWYSAPVIAIGTIFKALTDKAEKSEQIKDNYRQLAQMRDLNRSIVEQVNLRLATEPLAQCANESAAETQGMLADISV